MATGREHLGQIGGAPVPHSHNDAPRIGIDWSANDGKAMGTYLERYMYDAVGNFMEMQHRGSNPVHAGWTRTYLYDEDSLVEAAKQSNRLSSTTLSSANAILEPYTYDAHGNMTRMSHLPLMQWDYRDQLQATARQVVTNGTSETTFYVYDAGGQRVRKVTERQNGTRKNERTYLGGFEVYREYDGSGNSVSLERESLHVMDDKQRIALVETKTLDVASPLTLHPPLVRYQFGNHLGSASLELDDVGQIISYEEYTPYGSTSYQAGRSAAEVSLKRYRYTGKERDEETGLNYHSARYYAPWLGRWVSCDPAGAIDGYNLYAFSRHSPIVFVDPEGTNSDKLIEAQQRNRDNITKENATSERLQAEISRQQKISKVADNNIDAAYKELDELNPSRGSERKLDKKIKALLNTIDENVKLSKSAKKKELTTELRLIDSERKIAAMNKKSLELNKELGQRAKAAVEKDLKKAQDALKPKGPGPGRGPGGPPPKMGKHELMNNRDFQDFNELTGNKKSEIEAEIDNQEQWGVGMLVGLATGPVGAFKAVLDPEGLPKAAAIIMVSPSVFGARGGIGAMVCYSGKVGCGRKPPPIPPRPEDAWMWPKWKSK